MIKISVLLEPMGTGGEKNHNSTSLGPSRCVGLRLVLIHSEFIHPWDEVFRRAPWGPAAREDFDPQAGHEGFHMISHLWEEN